MKHLLWIIPGIFVVFVTSAVIIKNVQFNQNCGGYLKRAADANTVEMAISQLDKAIEYIEANGLTTGYTSVLWKTPDEDIGFWYDNIKACRSELFDLSADASPMERTNMLMKLRETLTDEDKDGVTVTFPNGISRHPNNALWGVFMWISALFTLWLIFYIFYLIE